ncbi:MAG: nuclear transport factor 2 family protein [Actinomycetota bacterium]
MPAGEVTVTTIVALAPDDAFDLFTEHLDRWWVRAPSMSAGSVVHFEGGRLIAADANGADVLAVVSVWSRPSRIEMQWGGPHAEEGDRVAVEFQPEGEGTRVTVHHLRAGLMPSEAKSAVIGLWWGDLLSRYRADDAAADPFGPGGMEATIRRYFDACNSADADAIAACFTDDAVHYFPPGMYGGPFVGGRAIAERWVEAVASLGSRWTVDQVIADPASAIAVIEWTHFKTRQGKVLRGDEWYRFDPATGLIAEIRAYYASPQSPDLDRLELAGFDYQGRGYPLQPPFLADRDA